jgi:nucleoside-triphosphatase THEP1
MEDHMSSFVKAERKKAFIKLAITGISGSGKTYSSLRLARGLVGEHGRIAFIDTENGSATLYDNLTDFDHCEIKPDAKGKFNYNDFIAKVHEAEQLGYDAVIVDSATHLWQGILDDKANADLKGGNSFTNWAQSTQNFNAVVQKFLQSRIHLISCIRSKTEYKLELNDKGKNVPKLIGLAPVMRDGIEYEFSIVFDVQKDKNKAIDHKASVSKDRTNLFVNEDIFLITEETGRQIADWLASGKDVPPPLPSIETEEAAPYEDRTAERAYLAKLADEGIIDLQEIAEIAKGYGKKKVTDLSNGRFELFMENVRLHEAIVREACKRNITRAKLDEFAREDKAASLFLSNLETKQKIRALVMQSA